MHLGVPACAALAGLPGDLGAGIINLEGPIVEAVPAGDGVRLGNGPGSPALLRAVGVRVAGVTNNHRLDAGEAGASGTLRALSEAGVKAATATPTTFAQGPWTLAVAQYELLNDATPDLAPLAETEADFRVATFHVTGPPSYLPRPNLRAAVDAALAVGVDVVAAHGTHVIGPVERRGRQVVAWGLGNLAFSCPCTREDEALLLSVELDEAGARAWIHPIIAGLDCAPARPAPEPAAIYELLKGIGSSAVRPEGARASF